MSRYQRQETLIGDRQRLLIDAHVAVVGAGGLGSPALLYLAGAGVGRITIIDDDVIETSNLHRQIIHTDERVGHLKAASARESLLALNPEVQVDLVTERLTWPRALQVLDGADVVLDGADNFPTRHVVSAACARLGIPHVWASILGYDAQLSVFHADHGPVYEDLFPTPPPPGSVPNCAQAGVLGPVVGVVGSALAVEALKLLTGLGEPLIGTVGYYSSLTGRWEYIPVAGAPETVERLRADGPPVIVIPEISEVPPGAVLIDVREPPETALGTIPGAVCIPLADVLAGAQVPAGELVVYCAAGVRSARAVEALLARGVPAVSLRGGYERWRQDGARRR
ncbi:ThiF family adenylyltransferase [Corynebacterium nasicanis]|uniref:ThiF family adenylyltransferase n=1 Tax=Corynebacterium nasicanis TaxID=1448267 RepID=A0ABW1QEM8_9CORY